MTWLDHPGLTRQQFANPTHLAWKRDPSIIALHSTEGAGYPSATTYKEGRSAPHLTVDPRGRTARQHYPLSEAAWALVAPAGVSTNTGGAVQVEIIGTCDPRNAKLPSVLTFDEGDLTYLAGILRAIQAATGIPLTTSVSWAPYPASYGATAGRLSAAAWRTYRGVLGHQHVPGNVHGDPGALNVVRLLELASGAAAAPAAPAVPFHGTPGVHTGRLTVDGNLELVDDGIAGGATIARWQQVMGTPIDGSITTTAPSPLTRAVQALLVSHGHSVGPDGVDGRGLYSNATGRTPKSNTQAALQRELGTLDDGRFDKPSPAIAALQRRLNAATAGSGTF